MRENTEMKTEKRAEKKQLNPDGALRRGYLVEDYRIFHIDSIEKEDIPPHFHGFHKLILLLKGDLNYIIEGSSYRVLPGEVLIVPAFSIHQPVIGPKPYERVVLWVSTEAGELKGLEDTFRMADRSRSYVVAGEILRERFLRIADMGSGTEEDLQEVPGEEAYGRNELKSAYLTEIAVFAGRALAAKQTNSQPVRDPLTAQVIEYISAHPEADLSAKTLANRFYVSESGLCTRFGRAAGCSIHQYVLQKRLTEAAKKMRSGITPVIAASQAGFGDYSTFFRAFKKYFEVSPRQFTASSGWQR